MASKKGAKALKSRMKWKPRFLRRRKAPTLLILWKPYIFSCLTKLENCSKARGRGVGETNENAVYEPELRLTLLCLK